MEDMNKQQEQSDIIDGLERLKFFNCRGGRELWSDKPTDVQDQDIESADRVYAGAINTIKNLNACVDVLVGRLQFHSCNSCKRKNAGCQYEPDPGDNVRSNCIYWQGEDNSFC